MPSYLCCLAGFDAAGLSAVQEMAHLLNQRLTAEWTFQTEPSMLCDLLVCDLESHTGSRAWLETASAHVRAAATASTSVRDGLVLRKPVQGHGPDGLVHVLNEAARLRLEPAHAAPAAHAPAQDELVSPIAKGWAMLWSALRSRLKRGAAAPPKPRVEPPPAAMFAPAVPAAPFEAFVPTPPPRSAVTLEEDGPPAAPLHEEACAELEAAPASAGGLVPYRPIMRSDMAGASEPYGLATVPETIEADLLTALRRFRSLSQVAVIRFNDMPTICVVSATEMFYSLISLQGLFQAPRSSLTPARVSIARNSHHGRTEAQSYYQTGSQTYFVTMVGAPLKHLFWVATLRCGDEGEVARYAGASFHFRIWPDLVQLPHESQHVTWCGMLARGPVTMAALAKSTGHSLRDAAVFLAACDELGILDRKELGCQPAPSMLLLADGRPAERAGTLRNLLGRFGLDRP